MLSLARSRSLAERRDSQKQSVADAPSLPFLCRKCLMLQLCQCSRSCVEESPRWIESPVAPLVMQRDASMRHPARQGAAGWRRDSTVVDRLWHSSQLSCSWIETGPLRTAIVIQEQNGGNTQIERMMVCFRILSLWNQLPCSCVERYSVRNETPVPARASQREVTLCCPARRDAVGWWKDLTAEGIEPNPGPRRRLPAGTRRVKVWCLNVGSAVAAWENPGRCSNRTGRIGSPARGQIEYE